MQTLTNRNKVTIQERHGFKEKCFKDAYGINCQIKCKDVNDENWDWVENELTFKVNNDVYTLKEVFKEGKDNSTDHVILEYLGSAGVIHSEKFTRHVDAELRMVSIMKERLNGMKGEGVSQL
jgi:hypothetical protein